MSWLEKLISWIDSIWADHRSEVIAAIIIGVPVAAYFALYFDRSEPKPYKIYLLAEPRLTQEALDQVARSRGAQDLHVGSRKVELSVIHLDSSADSAVQKAHDIINSDDALLVIGEMNSQSTELSLPVYFSAEPPVPFIATEQTDEDLLHYCTEKCYGTRPAPLLQLSPVNSDQAHWAVRFAIDKGARRFLIVRDTDSTNKRYTDSLVSAYRNAISKLPEEVGNEVQANEVAFEQVTEDIRRYDANCVLYAGGKDTAPALVKAVQKGVMNNPSGKDFIVILSDSVVTSQISTDIMAVPLVRFTNQSDAADYNKRLPVYAMDAVAIAKQLTEDLQSHGFDFRFIAKSWFKREGVPDARRNLVRVLRESIAFHRWYLGAWETAVSPSSPTIYAITDQPEAGNPDSRIAFGRRAGGLFHVWRWNHERQEMSDIDNWHPQRGIALVAAHRGKREKPPAKLPNPGFTLAAQKIKEQ